MTTKTATGLAARADTTRSWPPLAGAGRGRLRGRFFLLLIVPGLLLAEVLGPHRVMPI